MSEAAPANPTAREFEALLAPVLPIAYGVALRLVRNQADAEDLIQEAALAGYRGFRGFQRGTNFKAWYMKVLMNCFYARHRKARREPETVNIDDAPPIHMFVQSMMGGLYDQCDDPASAILSKLDAEQIAAAVAALPAEFRAVAVLYFIDDLSYEEIAEMLDCPIGTVRSRLHRARRMLQKALWETAEACGIVAAVKTGTAAAEEGRSAN